MKPGDLVAFRTTGPFAALIRTGQRIGALGLLRFVVAAVASLWRGWPDELWWAEYTHIAIAEMGWAHDTQIVQAVRRIDRVLLSSYGSTPRLELAFPGPDDRRADGMAFAADCVGMDYGVLSVVSRGINYLTPTWFRIDFSRAGRMDCSGFGARTWEHMGHIFDRCIDERQLTPGDLVRMFGTRPVPTAPATSAALAA